MKTRKTKQTQILEAAETLFIRFGIKRVTVEEICREAKVSKMTFYKYYRNKNDIAIAVLKRIFDESWQKYDDIMAQSLPFEEKMQKILLMKLEYSARYSPEFFEEFIKGSSPEIGEYIESEYRHSYTEIRKMLETAQKAGEIRGDIKLDFVMYMLGKICDVLNDANLRKIYADNSALIRDSFNFLFYGIIKRCK